MLYQMDYKVGPSRMKAENDDEKSFFVKIKKLKQWLFRVTEGQHIYSFLWWSSYIQRSQS